MIDIIIPAYNSHDTIIKTLASIRLQTIYNLVKIYIVDDCSDHGYSKEIEYFKDDLDITEIKTPHNMGPGQARQYAIDRTDGEYIVFMDADDQFYNPYVLNRLYYEIYANNSDMVYGDDFSEKEMKVIIDSTGSLHGKIYRRSFLKKNKIRFNNTRYSEDDSFNKIVMFSSNKIQKISDIVYLYLNNETSITNKLNNKNSILISYIYNMIWTALELKKRKVSKEKMVRFLLKTFIYAYKEIIEYPEDIKNSFYLACYRFEEIFSEYEKYMDVNDIINSIRNQISWQYNYDSMEILRLFSDFRKKCHLFKKEQSVDVIIYAHNSHKGIMDTLLSMVIQKYNKFKVYLVNDNSAKNYNEEINKVKDLIDIKEIKLKETMGRNAARQYAIDHSKSDYITFIEAGDVFNDGLAISKMIYTVNSNDDPDVVATSLNIEEPGYFRPISGSLVYTYGKLYKRSFLKKNKIKFPVENINIDYYYNELINSLGVINYSEQYSYIKRYDEFSGLKFNNFSHLKKLKDIETYAFNTCWIINELEQRKTIDKYLKVHYLLNAMYKIYYYYIPLSNTDIGNKILLLLGKIKEYYLKYEDVLSDEDKSTIMIEQYKDAITNLNLATYQNISISFVDFLNKIIINN